MAEKGLSAEESNAGLEKKLQILKTGTKLKTLERAGQEVINILYNAIAEYPTEVNAVQVQTSVELSTDEQDLPYSGIISRGRYKLEEFLKAVLGAGEVPKSVDFQFTKHLPYSFTTGTHGSGERNAMGASCPNISVEVRPIEDGVLAYLSIDPSDSGIIGGLYLLPDEIKAIRLVQVPDGQFTPVAEEQGDGQFKLHTSPSCAKHYLAYNGFRGYALDVGTVPDKKWKNDVVAIIGDIWTPEMSTGLFKREREAMNLVSFSGFAADVSGKQPVLYEFDKVPIPEALRGGGRFADDAMMVAYAIVQHSKNPQGNIKVYTSKEIIGRLAQAGVKRQF